jgi:hypothetical protein
MPTPAQQAAADRLTALAQRLEPRLHAAFLAYVRSLAPETLGPLVEALTVSDVTGAVELLLNQLAVTAATAQTRAAFATALQQLATPEASAVSTVLRVRVIAPVMSTGLLNALRRFEHGAFAGIQQDVRDGVREVVTRELATGVGPRQAAVAIKQQLAIGGLTAYDERIIGSFQQALREGRLSDALRRTIRDKRFDRTLRKLAGKPLSEEQIAAMTAAYRRKLVAFRADTFARTQAIQAANEATAASWRQAVEQGVLPASQVRRYWVVADDERLCPICQPMPERFPTGVGLDEEFTLPDGTPIYSPPAHPNCRCAGVIRRERPDVRPAPAPGVGFDYSTIPAPQRRPA